MNTQKPLALPQSYTQSYTQSQSHNTLQVRISIFWVVCDETLRCLRQLQRSQIVCPFLQTVMTEILCRALRENQSVTCTSWVSSSHLSVEDCCSFLLSTASSHTRYPSFCFCFNLQDRMCPCQVSQAFKSYCK